MESRKALARINENNLCSMAGCGCLTEKDRVRREQRLAKLRDEIGRLESGDTDYFRQLIISAGESLPSTAESMTG